ncbi:putative 2-hydroxyacid dehydrogenase [compost metagenome]
MEQGRLGGAALDVIEHEPPQADNPIFRLINHPNFILNPHVAWSSQDAMQGLINQALGNITHFVNSTPTEALRAGGAR